MNFSFNLRSIQPLTAATLALLSASAQSLRAALLGGLAILGCASTALGQDAPSVKVQQTDAHTLALTVENPTQQRVQLEVVAQNHYSRLLNEVHHRPSYGTKLGFNKVPAGDYAVRLRVGHESYRYHVQVPATPQTAISVRELSPTPTQVLVAQNGR